MFGIGFGEFAIIFVVLIVAVGPEKLPTLMKTVGRTIRGLRQASRDIRSAVGIDEMMREDFSIHTPPARKPTAPAGQPMSREAAGMNAPPANPDSPPSDAAPPQKNSVPPQAVASSGDGVSAPPPVAKSPVAPVTKSPGEPAPPGEPASPGIADPNGGKT